MPLPEQTSRISLVYLHLVELNRVASLFTSTFASPSLFFLGDFSIFGWRSSTGERDRIAAMKPSVADSAVFFNLLVFLASSFVSTFARQASLRRDGDQVCGHSPGYPFAVYRFRHKTTVGNDERSWLAHAGTTVSYSRAISQGFIHFENVLSLFIISASVHLTRTCSFAGTTIRSKRSPRRRVFAR